MKRALLSSVGRSMLVSLALAVVALAAPGVAAANPACGATIKKNIKLTSNMDCSLSATSGLVVGKSGITINLNGKTLTGPTGSQYGIDNSAGYDHVTVENGTIMNYDYGVYYQYTTGSRIVRIKALNAHHYGFAFWYSQNGLIDHSTASGTGDIGIYLYENTHVNLTNSKAVNDTDEGVYDYYSLATLDNVTANHTTGSGYGIYVEYPIWIGPSYYTIKNSTANHNGYAGIYITYNYPTIYYQAILLNNTANDNGNFGLYADVKAKGKGNHATGNGTMNCWHVPCG